MPKIVTAYVCRGCGELYSAAESKAAGPLVECECGQVYEVGEFSTCPDCEDGKPAKTLSAFGCEAGCCEGMEAVRALRIEQEGQFTHWRKIQGEAIGGLLVRLDPRLMRAIKREIAKEAP